MIVGINNRIFFVSNNVNNFLVDVDNWASIGRRMVDTDLILSSLAQVTSIGSCGSRIPAFAADTGPYVLDGVVSAIALMVVVFCHNTTAYEWCLQVLLLRICLHKERRIFYLILL